MLIDAEYETGGKINYDKIAEYEKEKEEIENKLFNLDNGDSVQPEKKENKFNLFETINPFARVGGMLNRQFGDTIRNFDGRNKRNKDGKEKKKKLRKDGRYIGDHARKKNMQSSLTGS